jgi:quinol monooxygenase YgiN
MSDATNIEPIVIHANAFVSRYHIAPGQRDAFITRFNALWQADIPGLQAITNFVFYGFGRDENEFVAIESWKDEAAIAAVRETPLFRQAVTGLLELCDKPMEMSLYAGLEAPSRALFDTYPAGPSRVHPSAGEIGAKFL